MESTTDAPESTSDDDSSFINANLSATEDQDSDEEYSEIPRDSSDYAAIEDDLDSNYSSAPYVPEDDKSNLTGFSRINPVIAYSTDSSYTQYSTSPSPPDTIMQYDLYTEKVKKSSTTKQKKEVQSRSRIPGIFCLI